MPVTFIEQSEDITLKHTKTPFYPDHAYTSESPELTPIFESKEAYVAAQTKLGEELTKNFPKHFGKDGQPWSVGIRDELIAHFTTKGHAPELIAQTLHFEARSVNYRVNCMLAGVNANRIGFDGSADGQLSRRDFIYNLTQLSGLVRRKDRKQAWSYKEWALRETVLGLVHGELTREDLINANLKVKFVDLCVEFANDPKAIDALALKNKRTGELHPSVYGAPYIPDELFNAFKKRNNGHVTAGKKKPKRIQLVSQSYKLFNLETGNPKAASKPEPKSNNGHKSGAKRRFTLSKSDGYSSASPVTHAGLGQPKQGKPVDVRVKRKKRSFSQGSQA